MITLTQLGQKLKFVYISKNHLFQNDFTIDIIVPDGPRLLELHFRAILI